MIMQHSSDDNGPDKDEIDYLEELDKDDFDLTEGNQLELDIILSPRYEDFSDKIGKIIDEVSDGKDHISDEDMTIIDRRVKGLLDDLRFRREE
jgi:hypothetical protein